ncbi:hypothetical protein IW261DRAFT_1485664 [Armillaria novae-zelandiae]|uniref:Uncharacterized protein n=1 Tax=Armillaria novae-zelandiae TaxID=153914 RepID=A0AA39U933_9AGAR|nr:hypothetical protein IW261DRAFT_1485664 [Armillaria novae-zelandiae]
MVGETGLGETTRYVLQASFFIRPKLAAVERISQFVAYSDLPHTKGKLILCTQPRRVEVISVTK